jgi:protoporphyrinogen/coproporphyrinogen III oxidase
LLSDAKSVVARDLGITADPTIHRVTLQRECIPQYEVGYLDRLASLEDYLAEEFGKDEFRLVGNSLHGISVSSCTFQAKVAANQLGKLASMEGNSTYLE